MDILDIQKALNKLRELLLKGDKIKQHGVAGPQGFQANPNQLSDVNEADIEHVPAQKSPGHDKALASRSSIPVSEKEPVADKKQSILETRPSGPIHKLGVWDKLADQHKHHLMNTFKQGDRDILNSILDARDRGGASHDELVGAAQTFIDGKVSKIAAAKDNKTKNAAKNKPKKELSPDELAHIRESVKVENDPPVDLSHIPLKNLPATKSFIQERSSKKHKFYHKAFNADGQYSKDQTIQAFHDWAHGRPLPKEVTSSMAFKTVSPNFYTPISSDAEKTKAEDAKATPTAPKEFTPKTISLDDED